jgi:hypothetical protein
LINSSQIEELVDSLKGDLGEFAPEMAQSMEPVAESE